MKKRSLGNTGIEVSEIAFGGVEIGMPYGIGVASEKDMLSSTEAVYLLHSALDAGVNFFDTARLYGESEALMGKAFKGRRKEVILETKCTHLLGKGNTLPSGTALKKVIETSLEESLQALQTDYIDVFMLHDANAAVIHNEAIASTFSALKQKGIIRATGISTYTPEETAQVIETGVWDVVQIPFNLMDQRQQDLFPLAAMKGIGLVVRSVLLKGLLSDRGKNLHPALRLVEKHIQRYQELVEKNSLDLPTLATRFALSFEEVSSILVGIDRIEYLDKSVQSARGGSLDRVTFTRAKELAYPDPEFLNLHQWNINGWLK